MGYIMHPRLFTRILIANRGEIAIRIARAAFELGIETVSVYAYEDRFSLHRYKTDKSFLIGVEGQPLLAYLDIPSIIEVAVREKVNAIHPGYGFLSENAAFAEACADAGIVFIGPSIENLRVFGSKVLARNFARTVGLSVLPGTEQPLASLEEATQQAKSIGYPVMLKASLGGGGKGIRQVRNEAELAEQYEWVKKEAQLNFGQSEIYLEKQVLSPKHIEVQILGDAHGGLVHLFERDCSIQRRNQKVVEVAPALGISDATRTQLHAQSLQLTRAVQYQGLGTVEFLVDAQEQIFFLEVNPRVQVEHTVTEMITGVDLIQASILVASGYALSDPLLDISQDHIVPRGVAIQCRITTEDPLQQFAPDTGTIFAYRPSVGFGIRLDEGLGTSGAKVTPFYDSLLVKVTAWDGTLQKAARKMYRCLSEFRIRGVKHNIALLKNIVQNPDFIASTFTTDFFATHETLFNYNVPRDRATKLLQFVAEATVHDPHQLGADRKQFRVEVTPQLSVDGITKKTVTEKSPTAKEIYDQKGSTGLVKWIQANQKLLLTDTTMRDAHQSLFATRLRTLDILKAAPFYRENLTQLFSLEVWGGATFDTCYRFLKEDPWERLALIREKIPNALLQMLLRGDNAVGYTNYPNWVIRSFIQEAVRTGLDLFRVFDCFNQPDKMRVALEEIKKQGAIAELCICYTSDLCNPNETKYTLDYYVKVAKELSSMGADLLCIKDMAGLLRPASVRLLIRALRDAVDLPIHLHTHDTAGVGVAMLLAASEAGCHIVDGAVSSMSGFTSQPSLNALVACLEKNPRDPKVSRTSLDTLARYWEEVRSLYRIFDPGIISTSTEVYENEIPGGQYSNLIEQAKKVGLSTPAFHQLTVRYKEVNDLLGNIIKVTPSSKVVGDLALFLEKQKITGKELLEKKPQLDYPDSVISLFEGKMGTPYGGLPAEMKELVLGKNGCVAPLIGKSQPEDNLAAYTQKLESELQRPITPRMALSSRLYPKVFSDYLVHVDTYGDVSQLPTSVFFYGLQQGQEVAIDIESGKTLYIALRGLSDGNKEGKISVFFQLNGFNREIQVRDPSGATAPLARIKANSQQESHIAAPMSGKVVSLRIQPGQSVQAGDVLCVTEAMKMEYLVRARRSGRVEKFYVKAGELVETGDLLCEVL